MTVSGQSGTGLYSPAFERDGCGFGLIAQMDDSANIRNGFRVFP